jgi:outer membrane protein assembly factor BamB
MPDPSEAQRAWKDTARQLLVCLLAVCLVSAFFMAVELTALRAVVREADPIQQTALLHLKQAASRHVQDDALKEAFRDVDEQARSVFYRARALQRRGVLVLLVAGTIGLAAIHGILRLSRRPPLPGQSPDEADPTGTLVRRGVLAAAITAGLFVVVLSHRVATEVTPPGRASASAGVQAVPERAFDAEPAQWPAFRGVGGLGLAAGTAPTDWDGPSGRNVLWKLRPPRGGFSSPIVWDDRLYLTGADEQARELYCFDALDGRLLWTVAASDIVGSPAKLPEVAQDTGFAAPTPVTDGQRVVAIFATGDILASAPDGTRLWARNLGLPDNPYGHGSSLVIHRGRVLVQYDHFGQARFIALDAASGDTLWEQSRDVQASWASPVLVRDAERVVALLNAEPLAEAFDAETGERLWSCRCMGGEVAPSPAYSSGLAFFTTDYVVLAGIHLRGEQAGTVAWETNEELPDVSSPLAVQNLLFVATAAGIVSCYEAATGKLHWRQETDEGYYASPVAAAGMVYLTDRKGRTRIFKAAETWSPVAECVLGEAVVSTPAFAGGRLYLRSTENLYCIGNP